VDASVRRSRSPRPVQQLALADQVGSTLITNAARRRRPKAPQRHQFDFIIHRLELRSMDFTTALNDSCLLRLGYATEAAECGRCVSSVR
jgi:hypothetical protein